MKHNPSPPVVAHTNVDTPRESAITEAHGASWEGTKVGLSRARVFRERFQRGDNDSMKFRKRTGKKVGEGVFQE